MTSFDSLKRFLPNRLLRLARVSRRLAVAALVAALSAPLVLGPTSLARAQEGGEARRIGLRDALGYAVKQNPTLATSTIDVGIAEAQIAETYGLDDWLVDAGASWNSERTEYVPGQGGGRPEVDTFTANAGISKSFADGGTLGLKYDAAYNRTLSIFELQIPGQPLLTTEQETSGYGSNIGITFAQPLLRGFGAKNRYAGRTTAKAQREVAELERVNTAGSIVRDVVSAYWDLAYATQDLEIRRSSLALAREQLRITQAQIDVGKLARTESLSVEQVIATREEAVFLAEQAVADRSIELRRLIGIEIGPGEIELLATDRLDVAGKDPDLDQALATAMENNPQLRTVRAQGKAAAIDVEVTENGLLPQLDFSAQAGSRGNGLDYGEAVTQMATFDGWGVGAGVTFRMNLGNRGAEGRNEAAKGRLRKARLTESDIRAQIAAQVVRAVQAVRQARKRMEVTAKASQLARQNVDLEKARWEVGRSTNFEVLRRQDELAQAQLSEARARADYLKAVAVLEFLTGSILTRYNIELAS